MVVGLVVVDVRDFQVPEPKPKPKPTPVAKPNPKAVLNPKGQHKKEFRMVCYTKKAFMSEPVQR